jgi:hypothetical protein
MSVVSELQFGMIQPETGIFTQPHIALEILKSQDMKFFPISLGFSKRA